MTNMAERVFDKVLADISDVGRDDLPDWPDHPAVEDDHDTLDYPPDGDESQLERIGATSSAALSTDGVPADRSTRTILPDIEKEMIEGGIRQRGLETLAFYKSRRFLKHRPFPGHWGIFYLESGLAYLTEEIMTSQPKQHSPEKLALYFLRAHEFRHYRFDLQTLMFEATLRRNLYIPRRNAFRGRRAQFVEEALANKAAYEWAKHSQVGLREFSYNFMSLQPSAYARFTENEVDLNGEWLANTLDLQPPGSPPRTDIARWVGAKPKDLLRAYLCPQHIVHPTNLSDWLDPALILPPVRTITEENRVKKLLSGKYRNLAKRWKNTKSKLREDRTRHSLNLKPWPNDGKNAYSVRINDGFRAHLRHQGSGSWVAYNIGPHEALGHG